ncbi:MAG TPA: hypothetical protein VFR47_07185 [Anaerolineales bacterium]|nr:hypothetical protein [Anaerolineales bacterium]
MGNLLDSHLIVFDGLPGSGKTTTGQWLTLLLQQQGLNARWLPEAEVSHPLWWYQHWDGAAYQPPDFENTPIETFIQNSLRKWKDFVDQAHTNAQLHVAESLFFQNAVAMFLMGGARPAMLFEYAQQVQAITQSLNPILIYFRQLDAAAALRKICTLRGQAFEDELIRNMERFPYLCQRKLKGLDGVTALWSEISQITDALFDEYRIRKLSIETSKGNWQAYQRLILDSLDIRFPR